MTLTEADRITVREAVRELIRSGAADATIGRCARSVMAERGHRC